MTADGLQRIHGLGEPLPRRVAVLRALQLGDLLCAVPAFRALRAALPEAEIILVGLPWAVTFVERFATYLDGLLEFPGYPGLPERTPQVEQVPHFLTAAQQQRFDLALQMHGSGLVTNPLAVLFGARTTAGFFVPGQFCPDPETFLPYPDRGPEVRRLLKLLSFLGAPPRGEELEFPLFDEDRQALSAVGGAVSLRPGTYACVHPGASVPERRWPVERFAAVARSLAGRGLRVVLTGTVGEAELTRALAQGLGSRALDLAGQTSLGALGALLRGARLLVCNDTGVSHLADALRVPSVVLSTGNNPERWAPADGRLHRVLCHPGGVSPHEVIWQAEDLLERTPPAPTPAGCVAGGA
jgi:ADP-heptose:LPS heptosyltransferase